MRTTYGVPENPCRNVDTQTHYYCDSLHKHAHLRVHAYTLARHALPRSHRLKSTHMHTQQIIPNSTGDAGDGLEPARSAHSVTPGTGVRGPQIERVRPLSLKGASKDPRPYQEEGTPTKGTGAGQVEQPSAVHQGAWGPEEAAVRESHPGPLPARPPAVTHT